MEKNHFKYWNIRKYVALTALLASAFCANSFNTSLIFVWLVFVALPIVALFLTSNDGDETTYIVDKMRNLFN